MSDAARTLSPAELDAVRAIALDAALAELGATLQQDGIKPLLIKGPVVARWLYDDPAERPYGDLDLLVHPDSYLAAGATLRRLGYRDGSAALRSSEQPEHESAWWLVWWWRRRSGLRRSTPNLG